MMPAWGTASLTEIIWTALGLVAWALSVYSLADNYYDFVSVRVLQRNHIKKLITNYSLRTEIFRHGTILMILIVGAIALLSPGGNTVTVRSLVTLACFYAMLVFLIVNNVLTLRMRRRVEDYLRDKAP